MRELTNTECIISIMYEYCVCVFHRILVLDQGEIREFDSPDTLMKDKDSVFASLARDAGLL